MMAKNSLQRDEEYEEDDYDEYDVDASEHDGDAQEAPKPSREEQQFLKLREQLKNRIREKMKNQSARALGNSSQSQNKRRAATDNSFGSFFGPSQAVIAPRVIEESRSIRDNKRVVANSSKSSVVKGNSISSGAREHTNHQQPQRPKVINETKRKAQTLKDMRDYSFLFSDDADMSHVKNQPVSMPKKQQPTSRSVSASKPYAQSTQAQVKNRLPTGSAQAPLKNRLPTSKPVRLPSSGNGVKNPVASKQNMQIKGGSVKDAVPYKPVTNSVASRNISAARVTNQSSMAAGNRTVLQKVPSRSTNVNTPVKRVIDNPSTKKHLSSAKYPHPSVQKKYPVENKSSEQQNRQKIIMKHSVPSSKVQPSRQMSSQGIHKDHVKKRPARRDLSDEEVDYRSVIRGMFGYNPNKYSGMDEDDSDMEVGFDVIQKEERRSAKIAREEDEEQLRLIEEEEEREKQRRMKKKLKRG